MDNKINNYIGYKIQKARKLSGYTQSQLASGVGLKRASICNIEMGRQALAIDTLLKCCAILKCKPIDIIPPVPKVVVKTGLVVRKITKDKTLKATFN